MLAQGMQAGQWDAQLDLEIANREQGARLTSCHRRGPLHVQKAFFPEGKDLAHLYILHPPGGLVSGDSLTVNARVGDGSHALITTPGAGRLYSARETSSVQTQNNILSISPEASLEWFPMETLFYSGSLGVSKTRIDIDQGGKFMGWDICCLGLPASEQPFVEGELRQRFEINYAGKADWFERWNFRADDLTFLNSKIGLQGNSCNGVFVAGPFSSDSNSGDSDPSIPPETYQELQTLCQMFRDQNLGLAGVSFADKWLAVRYLGASAAHARDLFAKAWALLRPILLERQAVPPRIWKC